MPQPHGTNRASEPLEVMHLRSHRRDPSYRSSGPRLHRTDTSQSRRNMFHVKHAASPAGADVRLSSTPVVDRSPADCGGDQTGDVPVDPRADVPRETRHRRSRRTGMPIPSRTSRTSSFPPPRRMDASRLTTGRPRSVVSRRGCPRELLPAAAKRRERAGSLSCDTRSATHHPACFT